MIPILFSFIRIFFIVHYVVTRKCYHLCQLLRVSKFSCNWLHRGTNPLFGCYHPVCDSYAQPLSAFRHPPNLRSPESSLTLVVQRKLYHIRTLLPRKLYHRVHGAKVFNFSKSVSPFYNRYPHLNINPGVLTTENIHRDLQ